MTQKEEIMKTTIYFHVTEELQKKLLAAGKDANESQSIELDITDQELIILKVCYII